MVGNQSILKEISPGCSLEGLMLKLKLQYFGHLMQRADSFWKDPDAGKDWGQEEKGTTEDMVGWHHWLNGHEFEWTSGVSDGQGGLACCSSWGPKELDTTEQLNWTDYTILWKTETSLCFVKVTSGKICIYKNSKVTGLNLIKFVTKCLISSRNSNRKIKTNSQSF